MIVCLVDYGEPKAPINGIVRVSQELHQLAENMTRLGHDVKLLCRATRTQYNHAYDAHQVGIPRLQIKGVFGSAINELSYDLFSSLEARKFLSRCDVVECLPFSPAFFMLMLTKKMTNIPFVIPCGNPVPGLKHDGSSISPDLDQSWFVEHGSALMQRYVFKRASLIIANSGFLGRTLQNYFDFNSSKLRVAPIWGVDIDLFNPHHNSIELRGRYHLANGNVVIVCGARVSPYKNQLSLIKSIPLILREHPEARFVFVGPISSSIYFQEIKEFLKTNSLERYVVFTGSVSFDELSAHYSLADVFVLLSTAEGLATTLLMAMSCGKAIVASSIPQNKEIAKNNDEAMFVDPFDIGAIASVINGLLSDPLLRMKIGKNARRTAVKYFSWQVVAQQRLRYYEDAVKNAC